MAMASSNGEPRRQSDPSQPHAEQRVEQPPFPERLLKLIENLHDLGILMTLNKTKEYRLNGVPYVYHTRNFEPVVPQPKEEGELRLPGDGHVKSIEKGARLHLAALAYHREHGSLTHDPLGLHERAHAFFEDLQRESTALPSEDRDAADAWQSMTEDERRDAVEEALRWTAPHHDLGNPIEDVTDWEGLLAPGADFGTIVKFLNRQRYEGSEAAEADMYKRFIDAFWQKLGWSETKAGVVKALGEEMILQTIYRANFVTENENPHRAMITLGVIDQIFSMLNASAERGVIGLINENRVRAIKGDQLFASDFDPNVFCGGFVLSRFDALDDALEKKKGSSFREYVTFLDEFRRANPEEFAQILSLPVERVREITHFEQFLRDRMTMQQEVARVLWPPESRDANGRVSFEHAFDGWTEQQFENLERVCALYQENFWSPGYTVEHFRTAISQPTAHSEMF